MNLGACHVEDPYIAFGQISTAFYFFYFILLGGISIIENSRVKLDSLIHLFKSLVYVNSSSKP